MPNLALIKRILAFRPGIDLISAMQGGLGVELARERPPNLVLLDLHLPDMSGEEALRQLRADPRTSEIPIVVISAQATPGSIQRILANGANAYLTKPLDVHEVLEVVRILPRSTRRDAGQIEPDRGSRLTVVLRRPGGADGPSPERNGAEREGTNGRSRFSRSSQRS